LKVKGKLIKVNRSKNSRIKNKTMDQQNQGPTSPEQQDAEFQRQEAIRIANQETSAEATPPDISPSSTRRAGSPTSDENFDGTQGSGSRSLEDRDTNDGDGNNENG